VKCSTAASRGTQQHCGSEEEADTEASEYTDESDSACRNKIQHSDSEEETDFSSSDDE
jgi:hypothetical protein